MNISAVSIHPNILRNILSVALASGALTVITAHSHAAELDPITISAPTIKIVGRDQTGALIEETTVNARIAPDAETLRTHSGVALLKERVVQAAHKACYAAGPLASADDICVLEAVKSAKPQVDAAIAQARSSNVTGTSTHSG